MTYVSSKLCSQNDSCLSKESLTAQVVLEYLKSGACVRCVCNQMHLCLSDSSTGHCLAWVTSPTGISSPEYSLITLPWNTGENYISSPQWSMDDEGNDGIFCAEDRRGWIQEALSLRADDRHDTKVSYGVTWERPTSGLSVWQLGEGSDTQGGKNHTWVLINTHTHTHSRL